MKTKYVELSVEDLSLLSVLLADRHELLKKMIVDCRDEHARNTLWKSYDRCSLLWNHLSGLYESLVSECTVDEIIDKV